MGRAAATHPEYILGTPTNSGGGKTEPIPDGTPAVHKVEVSVFDGSEKLWVGISSMPLEIGRQQEGDSDTVGLQDLVTSQRLVVAPLNARSIPRRAVKVESEGGELKLTNIHPRLSFYVDSQAEPLAPGEVFTSPDEIVLSLPDNRSIRLASCDPETALTPRGAGYATQYRTLEDSVESILENVAPVPLNALFGAESKEGQGRAAVDLVKAALTVVQEAAGSNKFFASAVSTVAKMIELDRALIVLRIGDEWSVRSSYVSGQETSENDQSLEEATYSRGLLHKVLQSNKTVIYDPANFTQSAESSMIALDRAVAAPIFDEKRQVIGVIYGDRKFASGAVDTPIGDLEATLLEVMAGAVSSGLARQRQEAIRSSLTQFFSHEIAERLENNEDLLVGKDADVTVLFCDIRGFSTIAERVGAKATIEWINDVLTELSMCVQRNNGVLVDYVGDELMAMWGAPAEQPDHAVLACRSAVEMLRLINPLRERWKEITPDQFGFGIGVNTGMAQVGNTGSKVKFKYGPLGNTVNLASRVQGITKKLGVAALITESTANALTRGFDFRRLALVRTLGIRIPVNLHELRADADEDWRDMSQRYEQALEAFEGSDLTGAARQLASLVHQHPDDNPSVVLLGRVVDALTQRVDKVDPIWTMDSK